MKAILLALSFAVLSGCCLPRKDEATAGDIPLAAVINQLRADLEKVKAETPASELPLTRITLTLKVSASKAAGADAGATVPFNVPLTLKFNASTTGTMENTAVFEWTGKDSTLFFSKPVRVETK